MLDLRPPDWSLAIHPVPREVCYTIIAPTATPCASAARAATVLLPAYMLH